ncbi:MAG TPA: SAM-dependent methyltransferase [Desulfobulbaceae bacterium]|nr:SAM-dependent methyltransferase [Desulfobulbaceae bacterium]
MEWDAGKLLELSGGYWAGCAVQAAVRLDIFTALAAGAKIEAELAQTLDCDRRGFAMLVTALVALGLLERCADGKIAAPENVLALLSKDSPEYLGFIIRHHAHLMPGWARLAEAVRYGKPTRDESSSHTDSGAEREAFLLGMFNIARLQAEKVAEALDLSGRTKLIDIGGGPGTYAVYFCKRNPNLVATIFDLPTTEPFAKKIVARYGLSERVGFVSGDFLSDTLPKGRDVAWLSQVLHGETVDDAQKLLNNAAACLVPGGLLCVQEFVLDDDRGGPPHAALFALNMLVGTQGGQTYTAQELEAMMRQAGAVETWRLDVALPQSCRILIGRMG